MVDAQAIFDSKEDFDHKSDRIRLHLARNLSAGDHATLLAYRLGQDHLENLKRLHTLIAAHRGAPCLTSKEGQESPSSAEPMPVITEQDERQEDTREAAVEDGSGKTNNTGS